jgi:hypothetical protein
VVRDNPGAKIVVWHTYIPETDLLLQHLSKHRIPTISYTGDPESLQRYVRQEAGVLLIRTSMCKGLNQLADADIAIFYSNPFSYARRAQAEGRSCRVSSTTDTTHYVDIVTKGGADKRVFDMLKKKKSFALTLKNIEGAMR